MKMRHVPRSLAQPAHDYGVLKSIGGDRQFAEMLFTFDHIICSHWSLSEQQAFEDQARANWAKEQGR